MNLLVLAKEQHIRTSCSIAAAYSGMNVTAVATAQKAIAIVNTSNVDILIADLKLCESDGLNLIKRLQGAQPELAIIGLTGGGTIDSAVIATLLGILHFLAKPFRTTALPRDKFLHATRCQGKRHPTPRRTKKDGNPAGGLRN